MNKSTRRQRLIVRLMILVVAVAIGQEVFLRYTQRKAELIADIKTKSDNIDFYLDELSKGNTQQLREMIGNLDRELASLHEKVLELPNESEASLLLRETISGNAGNVGLNIRSIHPRKSRAIDEERDLHELRIWFGYQGTLEELLNFFKAGEELGYYLSIANLNINARRTFRTSRRRLTKEQAKVEEEEKQILNGNVLLSTLFVPNPEKSLKDYSATASAKGAEGAAAEMTPLDDDAFDENGEALDSGGTTFNNPPKRPEAKPDRKPTNESTAGTPSKIEKDVSAGSANPKLGDGAAKTAGSPEGESSKTAAKEPAPKLENKAKPLTGGARQKK